MQQATGFIFDMNGTIIDDMPFHIEAWHRIITRLGANLSLEQVKDECYGKNSEILERIFPMRFTDAEKDALEVEKEKAYQEVYRAVMKTIPGLEPFLEKALEAGIPCGLGTAAIRFNVDFIFEGLQLLPFFKAIVSAEDVHISKPHPETFLSCAALMHAAPEHCIVFEDTPKGIETAANAGMKAVVLTTMHTPEEFAAFDNILFFISDYTDPRLDQLFKQ